jgi:malate permease and related proteins
MLWHEGCRVNSNVIDQVLVLTLMAVVGVVVRKTGVVTDALRKGMVDLLVNVSLPFLIIGSFNFPFSMGMLKNAGVVLGYSVAIHAVLIALSAVVYFRYDHSRRRLLSFATVFSNSGFVGIPVVQGLYGGLGVFYASIFAIPYNFLMFSYGVMLFTGERDLRATLRNLVNPPLISTGVGLLIFLLSIHLPTVVVRTCTVVGGMTVPLSMFVIGSMLADVKLKDVFSGVDVYYLAAIKLIVAPVLIYKLFMLCGADHVQASVCVLLVAMPTATMVGVFAEKYDGDRMMASRCAFLTTVLSMVTIPGILAHI